MRSIWWKFAGLGFVIACAGCSQLPGRSGLSKPELPSPQATIAAAKKKVAAAKPIAKEKQTDAATDGLSRGRTLERSRQYDKARKVYETALASDPHSAALLHRLGVVADARKRHGEAEQFFLAALQWEPRNADLLGDLGYCYYLQARLDQAESALAKAVALDPACPRHHNNLGLVLGHQRDYDAAFAHFAAAGSQADAYYNMAFIFAAQDLSDEAKGCFQEALAADPSHQRAKEALAAFEEYERLPADRRGDEAELAGSGVRYVPYIEGSESGHGDEGVQPASFSGKRPATRDVGRATRALQLQSRGLLGRHMQQQRHVTSDVGQQ